MAAIECQVMEAATGDLVLIRGKDHGGNEIPLRLTTTIQPVRDADGWPFFDIAGQSYTLKK